jgi:hypothetical protein
VGVDTWIILVVAAAVAVGLYLSWTAGRLDRLHARIEAAQAALDAQLVRRASVTLELATSGLLDPATSLLLAGAAHEAREASPEMRELAESDLSRALRAAFADVEQVMAVEGEPGGAHLLTELNAGIRRVAMARRFHNDTVRATQAVRSQRLVRYLRLAGRAPMPPSFEMDDAPPNGFGHDDSGL